MPNLGRVVVSLEGLTLKETEKTLVSHPNTAGIILFSRNYRSKKQIKKLIGHIQQLAIESGKETGLPIFVDQEGGWVQRFNREFTRLPAAEVYGEAYKINPEFGKQLAFHYGQIMAQELAGLGVISLAPVVDLKEGCPVIEGLDRAFHSDPKSCAEIASCFIAGMHSKGMKATLKHFPGHGSVSTDSHITMPVDNRTKQQINTGLEVFRHLIQTQKEAIAAVMPAHVLYPAIDPGNIATVSQTWLKTILRDQLGFEGILYSDCLSMKGAGEKTDLEKIQETLKYLDIALFCNKPAEILLEVLEDLGENHPQDASMQARYQNWVKNSEEVRLTLAQAFRTAAPDEPRPSTYQSATLILKGSQSVVDANSKL